MTVTCLNDRPIIDLNGHGGGNEGIDNAASFTEDAGAVTLAPDALVIDVDNANLASAQVHLTSDPDEDTESLAVGGLCAPAITVGIYNTSSDILTLSGSARGRITRPACGW